MAARIAAAERRRYEELAVKVAEFGYNTPPEVLMEYQELRAKHGPIELLDQPATPEPEWRRRLELDIDFLTVNMAATFRRQTKLEQSVQLGRWLDMIQIALLVLLLLAMVGMAAQWVDRFGWLW